MTVPTNRPPSSQDTSEENTLGQLFQDPEMRDILQRIAIAEEKMVRGMNRRAFLLGSLFGGAVIANTPHVVSLILNLGVQSMILNRDIKRFLPEAKGIFREGLLNFGIPQEKIENILNSLVVTHNNGGLGTGFFVDTNIIMTAGHIVAEKDGETGFNFSKEKGTPTVYNLDGKQYSVIDTYGDSQNDLGAIIVRESGAGYIEVDGTQPKYGKTLSLGFGGGEGAHVTTGEQVHTLSDIELYADINKLRTEIAALTNHVIPGDSGGPILDRNGTLIGTTIQRGIESDVEVSDSKGTNFRGSVYYGGYEPLGDIKVFLTKVYKHISQL